MRRRDLLRACAAAPLALAAGQRAFGQTRYQPTWESIDAGLRPPGTPMPSSASSSTGASTPCPPIAPVNSKGETMYAEWYWNSLNKGPNSSTPQVPRSRLRRQLPLLRFRAHVPRRALRPRPLGRRLRTLRRQVRRAHLQASRRLHALAQRRGQSRPGAAPGTPSTSAPSATSLLDLMEAGRRQGPAHGHLLFALRVVQPALALRHANATSPSTCSRSSRTR